MDPATEFDVALDDGTALRVLRFGTGERVAVAVHGITASAMQWRAVARALGPGWSLMAPDLRGRGGSGTHPGPFGLARHAADVLAVAAGADGGRPVTLVGHSMGAYVALLAAHSRPASVDRLLLVDGGVPLPVPAGVDPDVLLVATLGPAMERLSSTYPSVDAYLDLFRAHPALGPEWNDDVEAYVRYDAAGPDGAVRSRVSVDAVRADGRDLLTRSAEFLEAFTATRLDVLLMLAPAGMFGAPPGLIPPDQVARCAEAVPGLRVETVPDVNHYTIALGSGADAVARRIVDPWPRAK